MVVRKILEATLVAGSTSVTFTDTDIPNSLLRVYCSRSALFPISQTLSGNSVTVNYKPQDSNVGVALEIVKSGLDIIDDLVTEDSSKALSANQGYVLKGLIDGIVIPTVPENITDLDDVDVTDIAAGQVLAWDAVAEKFINVNQSGGGGSTHDFTGDEKIVGTWFGATLYEKSYIIASLTGSYTVIDNSITCLTAKIRNASMGTFSVGGGYNGTQYVDGRMAYNSFPRILLNPSGLQVGMETPPGDPITDFNFTIQYTKIS